MTATAQQAWRAELQGLVTNPADVPAPGDGRLAAILGDVPSTYAKSPSLWNAAFGALALPARYVPLDIPRAHLARVVRCLRAAEAFLGGSVTVPYKAEIIPLLDEVDPLASRIGAVNVIERTAEGRLIGHNTDGSAGVRALTTRLVPGITPPLADLADHRALLIGAGGAGQALACALWDRLGSGELVIASRTRERADALAACLSGFRAGRVSAVAEADLGARIGEMDLIVNASVKGQAGLRTLPDGRRTCLEPYSALAAASPAALPADAGGEERAWLARWWAGSADDIRENQARSVALCEMIRPEAVCYDIIYAPRETVFLRQARLSGHRTLNGVAMNVGQAVDAFVDYVCRDWLGAQGLATPEGRGRIAQAMVEQWGR